MQPMPSLPAGYEFKEHENRAFWRMATLMKLTGVVQLIAGVLQFGGVMGRTYALRQDHLALRIGVDLPVAAAFVVSGVLLFTGAAPFKAVVETRGNDIDHVMTACRRLSGVMTTLLIAFALATLVWLVVFIVLLVKGTPLVVQAT